MGTKRKYSQALLEAMKQNETVENVKGVSVLVKPIPEGGEPGDMDPRLYKSMKTAMTLIKLMPKQKKPETTLEMVLPLRKMFNDAKSIPITDMPITTEHVTVSSTDGYPVPVRVYRRETPSSGLPVFVYYHGGGFFGGSPDVVEQMCKLLVQNIDCVAFNVDYRLCPENHYPAPLDDCFAATAWAYENAARFGGDNTRMAVGGDSAGGNLAAAVTLRDREEEKHMVKLQVLLYPAVNISGKHTEFYHGVDKSKYQCSKKHEKVIHATLDMMNSMSNGDSDPSADMLEHVYLQGQLSADHIFASPLLDDFHDLPPTMLIFGEHDFLVFEDFAYAQTAVHAGIPLKTIVYRGMGHGFADQIGVTPQAEDCMQEIADFMKTTL